MSFVEFHQRTDGDLVGLAAYEADPNWELEPPSLSDGLIHPRVHSDEGTGAWIVFNPERNLWGAVVRSQAAPFNDCLPPGETLFLESFRSGNTFKEILNHLQDRNNESFTNPFEVLLADRGSGDLVRFHGSFQSERQTRPPGRYRLDDSRALESFSDDEWWGFSKRPDDGPSLQELTDCVSAPADLHDCGTNDGIRTLRNVLVFQWADGTVHFRTANVGDSVLSWSNPEVVTS